MTGFSTPPNIGDTGAMAKLGADPWIGNLLNAQRAVVKALTEISEQLHKNSIGTKAALHRVDESVTEAAKALEAAPEEDEQ
jgi:hypothetical protein